MSPHLKTVILLFTLQLILSSVFASCPSKCPKLDPDTDRDAPQLIISRGFEFETHHVTTSDGYILTHHRIINPIFKTSQAKKKPIILHHSLLGSENFFLINSPDGFVTDDNIIYDSHHHHHHHHLKNTTDNNLGFALAKRESFDVWLCNVRGTNDTIAHTTLAPDDRRIWNFSFDEFIEYDLPATIDYILNVTGTPDVGYVGHSQGTLIMFGLLSTRAEYSSVVKPFIALAPVASFKYMTAPVSHLADIPYLMKWMTQKGGKFPVNLFKSFSRKLCPKFLYKFACEQAFSLYSGYDFDQLNQSRITVYGSHTAFTSAKNLVHYFQGIKSGKLTKFDYGRDENIRRYGSESPPEYPIERISSESSIALFSSMNDVFATPDDVNILRKRLTHLKLIVDYIVPIKKWSHTDFIWAIDAGLFVNSRIINILNCFA